MSNIDWTQIDWSDLYPRLVLFAAGRLKQLNWRGKWSGPIPAARTATDFVHDAITKTIAGKRKWNGNCSLFDHFIGVISSDISHLVASLENRTTLQADEKIILIEDYRDSPEMVVTRKSQERRFFRYLERKNPQLRRLAEFILYDPIGGDTRIATELDLSICQLDSLKRALRRATENFLDEEEPPEPSSPVKKRAADAL